MLTIIILDCDSGYVRLHCHCFSISRVKGCIDHFSILWNIVIHNGHIKGELTHIIIEWAQTEVGEVTIVTRGYKWMKCELVCECVCLESLPVRVTGNLSIAL